jgi:hypothetical protein
MVPSHRDRRLSGPWAGQSGAVPTHISLTTSIHPRSPLILFRLQPQSRASIIPALPSLTHLVFSLLHRRVNGGRATYTPQRNWALAGASARVSVAVMDPPAPRGQRPCDNCRRRKVRCLFSSDDTPNCILCVSRATHCTYVESAPRKKKRPFPGPDSATSPPAKLRAKSLGGR